MRKFSVRQYALAYLGAAEGTSGEKLAATAQNFVSVLRAHGNLRKAERIAQMVRHIGQEKSGIAEVTLVTARALSASDKIMISKALHDAFEKKAEFHEHIDPGLIGGIQLRIGDTLIDGTVRQSLENLRHTFTTSSTS
ncbi:MAG: ATP synthase F1 subunit delta [Patescibacteria group bacterium]|jgi:F-type H+-transporting ATPase subunit delta